MPLRMPAMTAARGRALLLAAASVAAVLVVGGLHMAVSAACWCSLWHTVSSFATRAGLCTAVWAPSPRAAGRVWLPGRSWLAVLVHHVASSSGVVRLFAEGGASCGSSCATNGMLAAREGKQARLRSEKQG